MTAKKAADSFFSPVVTGAERDALMTEYLRFLEQRNGTSSPESAFPKREAWLESANASPERYAGSCEAEVFERNFSAFDGRQVEDPAIRALLAFVKINSGEAYGVEAVSRSRHKKVMGDTPMERVERLLTNEERYHTRILLGATHQFDLAPPGGAYRPPLAVKALIGALVHAPAPLFHPVLLGSEIAGLFLFNWLLVRVGEVFAPWPALKDGLEARLIEIIVDEIGHVTFNRAAVGPRGLAMGRTLSPHVARHTAAGLDEVLSMGWSSQSLANFDRFDLASLPESARRRAFFA